MDPEGRHSGSGEDQCLIPDLRGIALARLAKRVADGEEDVTSVVSRILDGQESSSSVPATMFNSSI